MCEKNIWVQQENPLKITYCLCIWTELQFKSFAHTLTNTKLSQQTPAARGLEELFSAVFERFLQLIHALRVYCKN